MKTILVTTVFEKVALSLHRFLFPSAIVLMAGCASEPESHVVSAPPPATAAVVAGTQTPVVVANSGQAVATVPSGSVVVTQAPPALQQEPVLARPSADHVWVPGYWTWRNSRYEWMAGHWEIPPRTGATWVAPRWEARDGAYVFYEGYWN